jgi:hypothetical protein
MPRDPELLVILQHARVCELKQLAGEVAAAAKPPRVMRVPKGRHGRRVLLLALRAERRRNAKLVDLLAR